MKRTKLPKGLNLKTVLVAKYGTTGIYRDCRFYFWNRNKLDPFWHCIIGHIPVVYFLMHHGDVVYIGSTINPTTRWHSHLKDKEFDKVLYSEDDEFRVMEDKYIKMFRPFYNGVQGRPRRADPVRRVEP